MLLGTGLISWQAIIRHPLHFAAPLPLTFIILSGLHSLTHSFTHSLPLALRFPLFLTHHGLTSPPPVSPTIHPNVLLSSFFVPNPFSSSPPVSLSKLKHQEMGFSR
ncbi:uncharacterized protein BO95DRAFT_189920 [Aspergillus brunneoviolaceus CBS 621.78]|uniref:Uncharacterized protein n=1 Tax=Aspergillus brunneoviolaceus CBS 621.78 TaxID=1450534 RepID=A0ACD1G473_9EURO|nr:hypothetical protein BO95DRAFT_189920 [Aspergillus brunneoviolaceus CBS 621.78]RAH44027.1 hypothetical protein BO95DRAFT_189920 [Aspergillus brunneoviolaceus CBS 621.78]